MPGPEASVHFPLQMMHFLEAKARVPTNAGGVKGSSHF